MPTQTGSIELRSSKKLNDVAAPRSSSLASTVSCYYRSTSSTTPAINDSTSIGTSNTTSNAWEYVMPVPKSGCYFFTCEKYTMVDGSVSFSAVRPLDSETYASKWVSSNDATSIDGGAIYARSITADRIASNSITIGEIDTSTVNIGGKNILEDSEYMNSGWVFGSGATKSGDVVTLAGSSSDWNSLINSDKFETDVYDGVTPLIFSFDIKSSVDCSIQIVAAGSSSLPSESTTPRTKYVNWQSPEVVQSTGGVWKRYETSSRTIAISQLTSGSGTVNSGFIQIYARTNNANIQIRRIQLERGNIASDWSQNPSDAEKVATNYLTDINNGGVYVHASDTPSDSTQTTSNGVKITDSIDIIRNGESVANYGAAARIGKSEEESRILLDYHSLQLIDKNDNTYFHVSDLRSSDGYWHKYHNEFAILEEEDNNGNTIVYEPATYTINVGYTVASVESVVVAGVATSDYTFNSIYIHVNNVYNGQLIEIVFLTDQNKAKAFTFGDRRDGLDSPGLLSFSSGTNNIASGQCSHAEGEGNQAYGSSAHAEGYQTVAGYWAHAEGWGSNAQGYYSHAEGSDTTASGQGAHAEGYHTTASGYRAHAEGEDCVSSNRWSHAEGYHTVASRDCAHAEGYYTTASGQYSHAEGNGSVASGHESHASGRDTIAQGAFQTVIGCYNVASGNASSRSWDDNAFIIGTGERDSSRANAFAVTWRGNVQMSLDTSASTGLDGNLYSAITALGWQSEVIV